MMRYFDDWLIDEIDVDCDFDDLMMTIDWLMIDSVGLITIVLGWVNDVWLMIEDVRFWWLMMMIDWWLTGLTDRFVISFSMFERFDCDFDDWLMNAMMNNWGSMNDCWIDRFWKMIDDRWCNSKEQWETGNSFERGMFRWFGNLVTHSRQKETNIEIWYHVITWFTPWYCWILQIWVTIVSIYDRMKILIYIYIS